MISVRRNALPISALGLVLCMVACSGSGGSSNVTPPPPPKTYPVVGSVQRLDPRLDAIIDSSAPVYKLTDGLQWAEGTVWVPTDTALLFSDANANIMYRWSETDGQSQYLNPSGGAPVTGIGQPGTNGNTLNLQGQVVSCRGASRDVAWLDSSKTFHPIADHYQGKRFNSPNDVVVKSDGSVYFTDPTYGLDGGDSSPLKEQPYNGVYRVDKSGNVTLLVKGGLEDPNGIAFSPDEKLLYITVSDSAAPRIMVYDVRTDGTLANGRIFFDASKLTGAGLPDGLRVDQNGNLFSAGPGGILVIAPDATLLGIISVGTTAANCAFGGTDRTVLYIAASSTLCRVQTKTHPK